MRIWPVGLEQIKREFGDPSPFALRDGLSVSDDWPRSILTEVRFPAPLRMSGSRQARSTWCHRLIAPALGSIFHRIHDAGLWDELAPWGGCYCWRPQSGHGPLSTHAWGIAIDVRVSSCERGTPGDMPDAIVDLFADEGWTWGGHWVDERCDPMHFQAAGGY